jgi:hypothetical protein
VPRGLTIKVWKGGPGPIGSSYIDTFTGCMISSFTVEQAADQAPLWTFTFVGKAVATALRVAETIPAVSGAQLQKYRDLSNTAVVAGYFKTGATLTALNIDGYRLTYDRKLETDPAFINSPDAVDQPGASDIREVTFEINSRLEQEYGQANKPTNEYNAGISNKTYALRIEAPAVGWSTDQHSLNDPANPPTRWTATAIAGVCDTTSALPDETTDLRIMTVCLASQDADAAWNLSAYLN